MPQLLQTFLSKSVEYPQRTVETSQCPIKRSKSLPNLTTLGTDQLLTQSKQVLPLINSDQLIQLSLEQSVDYKHLHRLSIAPVVDEQSITEAIVTEEGEAFLEKEYDCLLEKCEILKEGIECLYSLKKFALDDRAVLLDQYDILKAHFKELKKLKNRLESESIHDEIGNDSSLKLSAVVKELNDLFEGMNYLKQIILLNQYSIEFLGSRSKLLELQIDYLVKEITERKKVNAFHVQINEFFKQMVHVRQAVVFPNRAIQIIDSKIDCRRWCNIFQIMDIVDINQQTYRKMGFIVDDRKKLCRANTIIENDLEFKDSDIEISIKYFKALPIKMALLETVEDNFRSLAIKNPVVETFDQDKFRQTKEVSDAESIVPSAYDSIEVFDAQVFLERCGLLDKIDFNYFLDCLVEQYTEQQKVQRTFFLVRKQFLRLNFRLKDQTVLTDLEFKMDREYFYTNFVKLLGYNDNFCHAVLKILRTVKGIVKSRGSFLAQEDRLLSRLNFQTQEMRLLQEKLSHLSLLDESNFQAKSWCCV